MQCSGPAFPEEVWGAPTVIAPDITTETKVSLRECQEFPLLCPFTWFHLLKSFTHSFTHSFIHYSKDTYCDWLCPLPLYFWLLQDAFSVHSVLVTERKPKDFVLSEVPRYLSFVLDCLLVVLHQCVSWYLHLF